MVQDAIRVNLPSECVLEAVPTASSFKFASEAAYTMKIAAAQSNVATRRTFASDSLVVPLEQYGDLRTFYSQFELKDQESIVLKSAHTNTASSTN